MRIKTAKGRKISSTRWLDRHINDVYVLKAKKEGFRSRAAYKLIEINDKFSLFNKDSFVIDLGSSPGSWSQVVSRAGVMKSIAIDLKSMDPIHKVDFVQCDFLLDKSQIQEMLKSTKLDVVISDMAPSSCGHREADHLRSVVLCEAVIDFIMEFMSLKGNAAIKLLQGSEERKIWLSLKSMFVSVKYFKPKSSRKDSKEIFLVCIGFIGK